MTNPTAEKSEYRFSRRLEGEKRHTTRSGHHLPPANILGHEQTGCWWNCDVILILETGVYGMVGLTDIAPGDAGGAAVAE